MPSAQELTHRGQQYRNYQPEEFLAAVDETPGNDAEVDRKLRDALDTIESGRFTPFLEATSAMFSRLDSDERELFTRRNPVLVQWMGVYNTISDHNPYTEWYDLGDTLLGDQPLTSRTGRPDRSARVIRDDVTVPPFERPTVRDGRTRLQDMAYRRRSYRNWSPFEFHELVGDSNVDPRSFEISRGFAQEISLYDPEVIDEIDDWPIDVDGDVIARALLDRVEAGRFAPMLKAGHRFVSPLDPDEMEEWTLQNPGITVWISAFGYPNHKIHTDQLLTMTGIEWPPLAEVAPDAGWTSPRAEDVADRVRRTFFRRDDFTDATVKQVGSNWAVDYKIESPDPTEVTRQVASSFILDDDASPSSFILRFPEIETDDNDAEEVWQALDAAIDAHGLPAEPYMEGGTLSNHPHIDSDREPGALPDDAVALARTLGDVRDTFYEVLRGGDTGSSIDDADGVIAALERIAADVSVDDRKLGTHVSFRLDIPHGSDLAPTAQNIPSNVQIIGDNFSGTLRPPLLTLAEVPPATGRREDRHEPVAERLRELTGREGVYYDIIETEGGRWRPHIQIDNHTADLTLEDFVRITERVTNDYLAAFGGD